MKTIFITGALGISSLFFSQVGVNTTNPKATFDINAKEKTGTSGIVEGLLIPRVDRQRAQSMTGVETSTMIYIDNVATGAQTGTAINVDRVGYYFYDGNQWVKLNEGGSNIYNRNGTLLNDRTVSQGANKLAFTGSSTNAFSVDGSTFSVDANNDRIGIGTIAPANRLHVKDATDTNQYAGIASFEAANATQGVGIGYGGIQSIGSNANVSLNLNAKGTGNVVLQTQATGNVGVGNTLPTAKLDVAGSATVAPIRVRGLESSFNATLADRTTLAPAMVDGNGVIVRQFAPYVGTGGYSFDAHFLLKTNGAAVTTFTAIASRSIVSFKFTTNITFANGTGLIYAQVSFSQAKGFQVASDWSYSGSGTAADVTGVGTTELTFGSTAFGRLIFSYNSTDNTIEVRKTGGSINDVDLNIFEGRKIR